MMTKLNLLDSVKKLKKSKIRSLVDARIREFSKKKNRHELFSELCFCLLTANSSAEQCIRIQKELGEMFCSLSEKELATKLMQFGHRFPNTRARYIAEARKHINSLPEITGTGTSGERIREWLVRNVKGLGYKEASHFLRNIGCEDLAIVDFHIMDLLASYDLIQRPKTLTKRKYLEIEAMLKGIARALRLTLAELDFYLWYMETGKVLK